MNIKSLLLGSAAALIAVSGARAADAVVVAEPEPAEYVKICDVYGAGYFYIPGTETCLKIGGYVRYQIGAGDVGSFDGAKSRDYIDGGSQGVWQKNTRFTLQTYTGSETELGTLKTFTETRFNFGNNNSYGEGLGRNPVGQNGVSLNFAWIQLGGLRVGADESAFNTFTGYAGNVMQDTIVPYGGFETDVVQYYFDAGNGFSAVVSLETGSGNPFSSSGGIFQDVNPVTGGITGYDSIDSYVPFVVGGAKYTQGWGSISGVVAYNSSWEEWAGKVRLDITPMQNLSLFIMGGYGSDDNIDRNFYKQWGGNWAVWGGGTYTFNEKTSFSVQVSADDDKNYGVAANVKHELVPGFTVQAELDYAHDGNFGDPVYDANWTNADSKDSLGGLLRFQRSF